MLKIVYPPLRQPQKDHDFDGFLHFLEKLERSLGTIFQLLKFQLTTAIYAASAKTSAGNAPLERVARIE